MRSGKSKKRVVAALNAMYEPLEARQLLSAAVHTAVQKALSTSQSVLTVRHHARLVGPPQIAATSSVTPAASTAAVASPSATTNAVTAGLNDAVYHGNNAYTTATPPQPLPSPDPNPTLTDGTLGGDNAAVSRAVAYAASHTPNYSFVNSNDSFVYAGGSGTTTPTFLNNGVVPTSGGTAGYGAGAVGDASGAAVTDPADVADTIFDAEGYLQLAAGSSGTYTVQLGGVDDLVAVYMGGNGTAGSGTLVASAGWQGANAGTPGFQFTVPAAPDSTSSESIPVEILYANGFGGANLNAVGSGINSGVGFIDPFGSIVTTAYQTTPTNEPLASAPTLSGIAGSNTVALNWGSVEITR